jgi:membrane-associated protease RseP (regulator of RpoE activity)
LGASPLEPSQPPPPAEPWISGRTYAPPLEEPRPVRSRLWQSLGLLLLTVVATNQVAGPIYSACVLAILGTHELGHYLACRYYRIDSSPPYFLPAPDALASALFGTPILLLFGTLGAFIRIRQPFRNKQELFDVGIAGPIAGFLVALPILIFGVILSPQVPIEGGLWLGEPLLIQGTIWIVHGALPAGQTIALHPMAFAAWFGLLATSMNLFPIGQLDGGHISYAVLGRRSTFVTLASVGSLVAFTVFSLSWLLWAALTVIMLIVFGPAHPRTLDEDVPLDPTRMWLAGFALLMFIVCFMPVPLDILEFPGK